jgi:hypothetical protein
MPNYIQRGKTMRKLWSALLVLALISGMMGPVSASGDNWIKQDQVSRTYTYDGHTLGKFYAVQGSPDAEYLSYIVFDISKRVPWNPSTWRVSSFKKENGDSWRKCTFWIFCTYYWGETKVKKYEDYYDGGADPQWYISYDVAYRYTSGSSIPYSALDSMLKETFDAVLSLAGSPIGASWIFDEVKPSSNVIEGLGTNHLTVNLRTGTILWQEYYDSQYGLIKDKLSLTGGKHWADSHSAGYGDWIDFDAKYQVETGYYFSSPGMDQPTYVSVKTDTPVLFGVDVYIALKD